ncbi:MAG: hypothetical protein Q9221_003772 [Calogaya cf. arnoldii]
MTATTRISSSVPDSRPQMLRPYRRTRRRSPDERRPSVSSEEDIDQRKPNAEDLRRIRAEYYKTAPGDRHASSHKNMDERSTSRRTSSARIPSSRGASEFTARGVQPDRSSDHHHNHHRRRRRTKAEEHDSEPEPVYVYHTKSTVPEPPRLHRSRTTATASASRPKEVRRTSDGLPRNHTERRKSRHKEDEITVKRVIQPEYPPGHESPHKNYRSRPSVNRSASTRDTASVAPSRPSLLRSQTTTRKVRPPPPSAPFPPSVNEPTPSIASRNRRSFGFFGSILGISKDPPPPEKRVECLTYKLFDLKFKMKWNQKYQEYTTKNRLYCPARGCGEWIKPANIHVDTTGGANMERNRTCPKDDATKQFIEIAKKEGWQRCYNCSATVELKEGCNHMTCRCKAEFCMICGVKWKGCDCPWFNYQTVEQDRLNHMNVPVIRRVVADGQEVDADHPRAARGYQAELDARRDQERRDEQLARRLQTLGLDPPGVEIYQVTDHDYNSHNHGFGVGNTAGHHMNMHFVPPPAPLNMPSIPYHNARQAQPTYPSVPQLQPQPLLRQHSQASRAYNNHRTTRPAERVVPRRSTTDYEHEAAVHAPLRSAIVGLGGEEPRGSALAGLTRGGTAEGRVDEWRRLDTGSPTIYGVDTIRLYQKIHPSTMQYTTFLTLALSATTLAFPAPANVTESNLEKRIGSRMRIGSFDNHLCAGKPVEKWTDGTGDKFDCFKFQPTTDNIGIDWGIRMRAMGIDFFTDDKCGDKAYATKSVMAALSSQGDNGKGKADKCISYKLHGGNWKSARFQYNRKYNAV